MDFPNDKNKNGNQSRGLDDSGDGSKNNNPKTIVQVESILMINHDGIDHPKGTIWEIARKDSINLIKNGAVKEI